MFPRMQIRSECWRHLRLCIWRNLHFHRPDRHHNVSLSTVHCSSLFGWCSLSNDIASCPLRVASSISARLTSCRWLSGLLRLCFRLTFIEVLLLPFEALWICCIRVAKLKL